MKKFPFLINSIKQLTTDKYCYILFSKRRNETFLTVHEQIMQGSVSGKLWMQCENTGSGTDLWRIKDVE